MKRILLLIAIFLFFIKTSYGEIGLVVTGGFEIILSTKQVQSEKEIILPALLIYPSDNDRTFEIKKYKPSKIKAPEQDIYSDLPLEYLVIKTTSIFIPKNETGKVYMSLNIPNKEEFRKGGAWHISIYIRQLPRPGQFFSIGVFPRIKIKVLTYEQIRTYNDNGNNDFDSHNSTPIRRNKQSQKIK